MQNQINRFFPGALKDIVKEESHINCINKTVCVVLVQRHKERRGGGLLH